MKAWAILWSLPVSILLAIDPGISTGCALFVGGILVKHWLGPPKEQVEDILFPRETRVVIERPQVYTRSKSYVDPNDLITLALTAGAYGEWARGFGIEPEFVKPAEWKGQVDKLVTYNRVVRACPGLDLSMYPAPKKKFNPKDVVYNVTDAIGIGLWALTGKK